MLFSIIDISSMLAAHFSLFVFSRKNQTGRHIVKLPWEPDCRPLMLAPMQGLTNRALRTLFINRVRPDVVFTEYVRAQADIKKCISDSDRREIRNDCDTTPLVVQLIGSNINFLVAAANTVQELGAEHLNINLGCPYGRMTSILLEVLSLKLLPTCR